MFRVYFLLVLVHAFASVIFLGEFLVSQELWVHALGGNVFRSLGLLDAVTVGLVGVVVCASILLL